MINKLIDREISSWTTELSYYRLFLKRGIITSEQEIKYNYFEFGIMSIIKELEEMKDIYKNIKSEKKYEIIKLYSKKFKDENDKISYGFFTTLSLPVFNEENLGPQVKFVKILFNEKFIDKNKYVNGGTLLIDKEKMTKPYIYKIDENGKKPYIWIDEIEDFYED